MHGLLQPTAYGDVNVALAELLAQVQTTLGVHFVGMYLSGSLALGDFAPSRSDIDLMVVTDDVLAPLFIDALRTLHARFDASDSPWAAKVEAVYIARDALRRPKLLAPNPTHYPQVEKSRGFFMDRLEDGWLSQCLLVREQGVVLAGPDTKMLIDPVDPNVMRRAMARIPTLWLDDAHNDPAWLAWLCTRAKPRLCNADPLPLALYARDRGCGFQATGRALGTKELGCALGRTDRARVGRSRGSRGGLRRRYGGDGGAGRVYS